uniref:Xin actin binding repeat containing 2 n=1 Tax=Poecilia formosa TaxID=48698 RepID=A0A096M659_POEFO
MSRAAVSKRADNTITSGVMEESEVCSLPGGLTSVRKQIHTQEASTSHSVAQFHFHHKTEQEMSTSEVTVSSGSRSVIPGSQQLHFQETMLKHTQVTYNDSNLASSYENHQNDLLCQQLDEEFPRFTTKELRDHFERTIEEAAAQKPTKIGRDINRSKWSSNVNQSNKLTSEVCKEFATESIQAAVMDYEDFPPPPAEDSEYLPPPPPDLLQMPSDSENIPVSHPSHEPLEPVNKQQLSREAFFKQKGMSELKRLYKHIHPEVRKNIEKEYYSEYSETENNQVESQVYTGSPDDVYGEEYEEWEEILPGEVQAMRWMFENKPLDAIKDETPDEEEDNKKITQQEIIVGKDVRRTAWMFETKPMDELGSLNTNSTEYKNKFNKFDKGDVRAAAWLFETQNMDTLNKMHKEEDLTKEILFTEDDGNASIYMIDSKLIESLGHTETIDESHLLSLRSVLEEISGEVKVITSTFDTQFKCVIIGQSSQMLEIKSVRKIETELGNSLASRWLFDTQPLDLTNKEFVPLKLVCSLSMEDSSKGDWGRWLFEIKTLNSLHEWQSLQTEKKDIIGADVRKHRNCWVFETQPMDTLKDDSNTYSLTKEEIVAGNVRSAREYFETIPSEDLKELAEVGKLNKTIPLNEEKGDVRHQKWIFESQPLEEIREEKKKVIRTIDLEEIDKVDVSNYKHIFESTDFSTSKELQMIAIEGVTSGSVKSNKNLFESSPLYAMQDSSGHFHEVKTVRREEVVKGDVTTYKWMFETRPIDQFDDSVEKYQIIKGISKQEVESGDVKTAKWLFETQPLDAIKYFSNLEDEEAVETNKTLDIVKGDVKTCKWLFETKPMDILYEKVELKGENESEEIRKGDVKTCTWLFETQTLDSIHDETETVLKTRSLNQDDIKAYKRVTEIDIASGDVSRKKYIFENQTSDIMTSSSDEVMQKLKRVQTEDIQKGNVVNCKWLFENQSIDQIHDSKEEYMNSHTVSDVQRGDVNKGRFIFETYSLDKIQEVSSETENIKTSKIVCDEEEKGDVRNYTMMFETQPLYAIQDKEGHYHEVTTVTSEEVKTGDVVGTRWLFETKPLDAIKNTDEVYIIKSVTQQDVQKGDVTSAKWKFETQPLDRIAEESKPFIKTVEDIQGGNVRVNKQRFETDTSSEGSVRTVNVSEIQRGDVRSAKWRFETQSIDKIRSMSSENLIETVKKEEVAKGDVKHSVWLFEKNPLDHIKEVDEGENISVAQEEIPKADVKTTTWLFETTPFDGFSETKVEKTEILGKSIKGTLEELYSQKMVNSTGILIEADEIGDVRMAKYQLMNQQTPEIQREEIIRGDLQTIMMNLLNRKEKREQQIVIDSEEKGNISSTVEQLFSQEKESNVEKEEILRGDIQETINNLFSKTGSAKQGILIQEDEKGDVRMTLYSLLHKNQDVNVEKEDVVKGDIKSALERLSSSEKSDQAVKIKIDDTERGNVNFYSTCIESGALDYLKQLQLGPDETLDDTAKKEKIIGGDIKSTKSILGQHQMQIERTVEDVIPGDVHNALKVFTAEPTVSLERIQREEIVKGDLKAALSSLSESANQMVVVEKEEVVKGNIPKALRCLERAQRRNKEVEKPDIIPGNIRGALRSLEKSSTSRVGSFAVEDLVPGDVKATLKSLEMAQQAVKGVEKEEIVRGDIHMAMQSLQDASSERKACQQEIDVQGDVKGTIQMFMEPPLSPKTQQKFAFEDNIKGDIKLSIKSLYETQEQTQQEKEEVIKGDVKGTIKSLMETAQRETPKVRHGGYRRVKVKQSPAVKNLNPDAQRNIQKIKTAKQVETSKENHSITNQSDTVRIKTSTVVEHKTITQNHGIKTVKTEFCNLKSNQKGMGKLSKTKVKTDNYTLKSQAPEHDLPLPPPPPPVAETDLLPPPPSPLPPTADADTDHLPPPPPPLTGEQDFLPPPPPQRELERTPTQAVPASPSTAKRMIVKKVKVPALQPVPKLESKVEFSKKQQVQATSMKTEVQANQNETEASVHISKTVSHDIPTPLPESPKLLKKVNIAPMKFTPPPSPPLPAESPLPLRKVYIAPVKFTPPPSPPPFMRGKASKFNTALIKAEEKYRKLREENTPPTSPSPTFAHDSVSAALDMLSNRDQGNYSISGATQKGSTNTKTGAHSDSSMTVLVSDVTQSNPRSHHGNTTVDSTVTLSAKQQIVSSENTKLVSSQKISSISSVRQHLQTTTQKTVSVSSNQSGQTDKVLISIADVSGHAKTDTKTHNTTSNKLEDQNKTDNEAKQVCNNFSTDETNRINVSSNRSQENVSDLPTENTSLIDLKAEATEIKQDKKKDITSPAVAATPVIKKKKKSKKSKGNAQQGQGKENVTESNTEVKRVTSEMTQQGDETIAVDQIQKSIKEEHVQIKREVITSDRKDDQKSVQQKALQTPGKGSQKKEETVSQQSAKEQPKESWDVPITVTCKSEQNELVKSTTERTKGSQRQDVQVLISQITEIQSISEKTHSKSVKSLLNSVPDWIITPERKHELEQSAAENDAQTNEEIILVLKKLAESKLMDLTDETLEKHECEPVAEKASSALVAQRISKISIGSAKIEHQTLKSTSHESRKEEVSLCKSIDLRAPSPSLRMRPPSPTFITIESTRRTDSPQRVTPSPTLLHRPPTPPTPPPRRCDTPTSRITRITPSPTFDKAENLARLKETTAKLSRVVTPPPLLTHQVIEKKSEVVELPSTFHQNDVLLLQKEPNSAEDSDDSDMISASVKEKREFFEGAQKAELNKIFVRKEPTTISERLGPDMEERKAENKNREKDESLKADLSSFINKFESLEEKQYNRKELTPPAECLRNDKSSECDKEKEDLLQQEMPSFNIQAIKNVFELGEQCFSVTDERKDQEEQNDTETILAQPSGLFEAKTITEHFSNVDEFGNKVTGTITAVTQHSESVSTQPVAFSYADAVKKKAARRTETYDEDTTENLLRNFHKTWTESETVFKNLGYTVSEETSSQAVLLHQTKTVSSESELCAVCRRRAYPMDALIVDKKKYHKSCFCCEHCRNKLRNYVSLHGHFYCQPHYKQLLKSKGIYEDGLGQNPPVGNSGPNPLDDQIDWRYSMNSVNSIDKPHRGENEMTKTFKESKPHCNKVTVVWPPQGDPPKKTFKIEEDIQLTKPHWPPP